MNKPQHGTRTRVTPRPSNYIGNLTGREFEKLIVEQCAIYEKCNVACIGRYGVQATRSRDEWVILSSLPDFEGDCYKPRQEHVIFDAKVCSQASFGLSKYRNEVRGARRRQLNHMFKRDRFGAKCFFLIHWNERKLKSRIDYAITYRFPVSLHMVFWKLFEAGEVKSITRDDCETYGLPVEWTGDRKLRPDFL